MVSWEPKEKGVSRREWLLESSVQRWSEMQAVEHLLSLPQLLACPRLHSGHQSDVPQVQVPPSHARASTLLCLPTAFRIKSILPLLNSRPSVKLLLLAPPASSCPSALHHTLTPLLMCHFFLKCSSIYVPLSGL